MAKTQMIKNVEKALGDLMINVNDAKTCFKHLIQMGHRLPPYVPQLPARMNAQFQAAENAVQVLKAHLQKLEQQVTNPKTADKIKNLKNVFKDQADLAAKRKAAFARCQELEAQVSAVKVTIKTLNTMIADVYKGAQG